MEITNPWPSFTQEEADAVSSVLLSNKVNYWTGTEGRAFEKEFALYTDCNFGIALANGTVALDLALHALGIGLGDEVIVTPRTFIASVSSIVNTGAIPVFADVDKNSQNITPATIEQALTERTKAIVCVHFAGMPCDMDEIMALAEKYMLKVVEDCAQAHGAKYKGRSVGSLGHIGAWSFCQDKIMTTGGEGGMVTTNDEELWNSMWSYKDHGKSYKAVHSEAHPPGFRWLHESFGTNFRMTEMQSVIGRIQLNKLPEWTEQRNKNAAMLSHVLRKYEFMRVPEIPAEVIHAYYKLYAFIDSDRFPRDWTRDALIQEFNAKGISVLHGGCSEVYREKAFDNTDYRPETPLLVAKELGDTSLMFQVHPTISFEQMTSLCESVDSVLSRSLAV